MDERTDLWHRPSIQSSRFQQFCVLRFSFAWRRNCLESNDEDWHWRFHRQTPETNSLAEINQSNEMYLLLKSVTGRRCRSPASLCCVNACAAVVVEPNITRHDEKHDQLKLAHCIYSAYNGHLSHVWLRLSAVCPFLSLLAFCLSGRIYGDDAHTKQAVQIHVGCYLFFSQFLPFTVLVCAIHLIAFSLLCVSYWLRVSEWQSKPHTTTTTKNRPNIRGNAGAEHKYAAHTYAQFGNDAQ